MLTIKTILTPVDFSDRSETEAETATNIAGHFGSTVTLLHVIPRFENLHPTDPTAAKAYRRKFEDEIRAGTETALTEMAGRLGGGGKVETMVRSGDPAEEIESAAKECKADLVVLPTAGRGRFRQAVLGSVTTKALHDLECAVMTGVHLEHVQARAPHPYRRIGWLATLQPGDDRVLAWARDFAAAYGAELRALHAMPCLHSLGTATYLPDNLIPTLQEKAREKIEQLLHEAGVEAKLTIRANDFESALRELVKAEGVDLIITNRLRPDAVLGLGGLNADITDTVRFSPRPVISV